VGVASVCPEIGLRLENSVFLEKKLLEDGTFFEVRGLNL
jgi:hypothetical protein